MNTNRTYNADNIFHRILKKEVPSSVVFESDSVLAFKDINPKAKTHVLVIPKGEFVDFSHFVENSPTSDVSHFFQTVNFIATNTLFLPHFRLQINNGEGSGQEVFHFHVHILSNYNSIL